MSEPQKAVYRQRATGGKFLPGKMNPGHADNRPATGAGKAPDKRIKVTDIRAAVLDAFHEVGGISWLVALAKNPKTTHIFAQLLSRVMPTRIEGKDGGPVELELLQITGNIERLPTDKLQALRSLLSEIGVTGVAANESQATPLLDKPREAATA